MQIKGHEVKSSDAWEIGKILLIGFGVYKGLKIINSIGDDNTRGGGTGTAQSDCDGDFPNATKSRVYMRSLADAIESAVWGGFFGQFTEKDPAIAYALMQVNTLDDVALLICEYDVRGKGVIIQEHYNLPQTVNMFLDDGWKNVVNQDLQNKGINFQWA